MISFNFFFGVDTKDIFGSIIQSQNLPICWVLVALKSLSIIIIRFVKLMCG
jgi:hypothetical protein